MKILLHICCAHCLEQTVAGFHDEFGPGLDATGFFFNPNIHPLLEFRKRLKAVKVLNESLKLPVEYDERYGLSSFLRETWCDGEPGRCRRCYDQRLRRTAQLAWEMGFEYFSSTLVVSQHQDHDAIRQAGFEAGGMAAVEFVYRDLRACADSVPRRRGIYAQQYCGCIFSEEARFQDTGREVYRGSNL